MEPVTRSALVGPTIEMARIIDVDIDSYTVSVATQFSKRPQLGISFATPYQHFVNGEGIYFMPEVGSICWLCYPSDGLRPFVLAWAPASDEGNFRAKKVSLNPGDIYLGTRDENALVLRRGGVVEIGGGPLCQRYFLPINNTINDFCENYGLHTLGGDLEWTIAREETTQDGTRPANLKISAREFANDPNPIAILQIGSHENDTSTILSLNIKESGQDGADTKITLKMNPNGEVIWSVQNDFQLTSVNDISISSTSGNINMSAKSLAQITADALSFTANGNNGALLKALGGTVTIQAAQGVQITGPGTKSLSVDAGTFPVVMCTPALMAWITGHVHSALNVPATPALLPVAYMSSAIWGD